MTVRDYEFIALFGAIVCMSIVVMSIIGSYAYYNAQYRKLMAQNISEAVAKGMDPLSVRCTYANSQDNICIAYSASAKK